MPDLVEQMYCSQQIHIPPTFPFILKQYCKAAIRTQPYDLLRWSATYFRCLATGQPPPVKVRLEYPPTDFPSGLSPGYLKVLLKQFAGQKYIPARELYKIWHGVCLEDKTLAEIFMLGEFENEVELLKFIAIAAGYLTNRLSQTMMLICELLTEEPEGGSAMIPHLTFTKLYEYLAGLNCGPLGAWELSEPPPYTHDDRPDSPRQVQSIAHSPECSQGGTPEASQTLLPLGSPSEASMVPGLAKCTSGSSVDHQKAEGPQPENVQLLFKEALWSALVQNLSHGGHIGMPETDEDKNQLKDDIWRTVVNTLPQYTKDTDLSSIWSMIFNELPTDEGEEVKPEKERSKSQHLKDAIWNALSKKAPPEVMRDTLWEALTKKLPDDVPADVLKDELWNAILDKVPELKPKIIEPVPEGERPSPFGQKKPLPQKYQTGYVHPSGGGPPPRVPGYAFLPGEEQVPGWVGTPRPQYRIHIKGIGPVVPEQQVEAVLEYLQYWSERQEEMIMPRNIRYFLCPPLDVPQTEEEEEAASAEEKMMQDVPEDEDTTAESFRPGKQTEIETAVQAENTTDSGDTAALAAPGTGTDAAESQGTEPPPGELQTQTPSKESSEALSDSGIRSEPKEKEEKSQSGSEEMDIEEQAQEEEKGETQEAKPEENEEKAGEKGGSSFIKEMLFG